MSKIWYPVIDYTKCVECGTCVNFCPHGVYNKEKSPTPVVIYPEGCIQGCHGCGKRCKVGAIEYVGDTKKADTKGYGCSCSSDSEGCC